MKASEFKPGMVICRDDGIEGFVTGLSPSGEVVMFEDRFGVERGALLHRLTVLADSEDQLADLDADAFFEPDWSGDE